LKYPKCSKGLATRGPSSLPHTRLGYPEDKLPTDLARDFRAELGALQATLFALSPGLADIPRRVGGWTRKQIVGHLLDSATNNRQRFVRAALDGTYIGPSTRRMAGSPLTVMPHRTGKPCSAGGKPSMRSSPPSSTASPKSDSPPIVRSAITPP